MKKNKLIQRITAAALALVLGMTSVVPGIMQVYAEDKTDQKELRLVEQGDIVRPKDGFKWEDIDWSEYGRNGIKNEDTAKFLKSIGIDAEKDENYGSKLAEYYAGLPAETAVDPAWGVGTVHSGMCRIAYASDPVHNQTSFLLDSFSGGLAGAEMDGYGWCADFSAAAPDPNHQIISAVARVERVDEATGWVYMSLLVTPQGVTDGVTSNQWGLIGYQHMQANIKIKKELPNGKVRLTKTSAKVEITNGNSNYSLEGAHYGIWKNPECTTGTGLSFTTNKDGVADLNGTLPAGTYYVKEITAPKGYKLDTTVYKVQVNANQTTQLGVKDDVYTVELKLKKTSGNPDWTNGNDLCKLAGAEYSIYTDADCTKLYGKMVTDASGNAAKSGLPLNKYWVKETKAPNNYQLDPKVYAVDCTKAGATISTIGSEEYPNENKWSEAELLLKKVDAETNGKPQNQGTLQGAQFRMNYFDTISSTDPAATGLKPLYTWVFETDANGRLLYNDTYKVSGDKLYKNTEGEYALPAFGTVTFKEIKAPEGYLIDPTVYVKQLEKSNGSSDTTPIAVYNAFTQKEDDLELRLVKIDATTGAKVPGAKFMHVAPNGTKTTYTTDENGFIDISCLTYGTHKVTEIEVPDGYSVNTNEVEFKVAEDNKITIVKGDAPETDTNGEVKLTVAKDGCLELTVKNQEAPFEIKFDKENENGKKLAGAEFTIYSDAACKNAIRKVTTGEDGSIKTGGFIVGKTYYAKETKAPQGYRIPVNSDGSDIVYKLRAEARVSEGKFTFYVNDKAYTSLTK